jgi:hypothetical protein
MSTAVSATSGQTAAAWTREADAVALHRLDEVGGHARPTNIGVTYVEQEYTALGEEQISAWSADGECAARPFHVKARGHDDAAAAAAFLLREHEQEVRTANTDHQHATRVLQPYVRREPGAKLRYWVCWPILALGDASGVLSAAIMLGDVPWVATGQAISSGLAAACAGLVGAELKHLQLARTRRRDPDSLTEDERRYRHLFTSNGGVGVMRFIGLLSVLIVAMFSIAIMALRQSVEGGAAGLTFGLLAAATAVGSGVLSYSAADEVADVLTTTAKRVRRAETRHRALASAHALRARGEADAAAHSISTEYGHCGRAAQQRIESLGFRVLRRNPQVVGHGIPTGEQTGIVGRTRRGGVA